jgi:hypothetical protein
MGELCNSPKKHGGTCGRPAGWGTNHPGKGRCKLHGGRSTGPKDRKLASAVKRGNDHAVKTGEHVRASRTEEFERDRAAAPVDPTPALQERLRDDYARLRFMYRLLLQTEQKLMDLAAAGDGTALTALAVLEVNRKQEPRSPGDGKPAVMTDVEMSTKSRSLLDTWIAQHDAINRVQRGYVWTAERLKPPRDVVMPGAGSGNTTIIVNAGIPGVDYDSPAE